MKVMLKQPVSPIIVFFPVKALLVLLNSAVCRHVRGASGKYLLDCGVVVSIMLLESNEDRW